MAKEKSSLNDIKNFDDAAQFIIGLANKGFAGHNADDDALCNTLCDAALIGNKEYPYVDIFFHGLLAGQEFSPESTHSELLRAAVTLNNIGLVAALIATHNAYNDKHSISGATASLKKWGHKGSEDKIYDLVTCPEIFQKSAWGILLFSDVFKDDKVVDHLVQKLCEAGGKELFIKRLYDQSSERVLQALIENNGYDVAKEILFAKPAAALSKDTKIIHKNDTYALFLLYQAELPTDFDRSALVEFKVDRRIEGSNILYRTLYKLANTISDQEAIQALGEFAKKLVSEGFKVSEADLHDFPQGNKVANEIIKEIDALQQDFKVVQTTYLQGCKSLYGEFKQGYKDTFKDKDHDARNEAAKEWLVGRIEGIALQSLEPERNEAARGSMKELFKSEGFKDALKSSFKDEEIDKLMAAQRGPSALAMGFLIFLSIITIGIVWVLHKQNEQDKEPKFEAKLLQLCNAFETTLQSEYVKAKKPDWVGRTKDSNEFKEVSLL